MLFAIFCTDKEDYLDVRMDNRPAHVEHLKSLGDKLVFAGPTLDSVGETMNGSLIVVDFDHLEQAQDFASNDPYAQAKLFESVIIRPWKKVLP
ncbi:YciI family protein [Magnetovibrio sp.]|uniref:YciI family protein n=1 Tax=Magnetovibrio sp. TaxID=2024836 RepID=UPI002F929AB9